jgi:hypothetical protein
VREKSSGVTHGLNHGPAPAAQTYNCVSRTPHATLEPPHGGLHHVQPVYPSGVGPLRNPAIALTQIGRIAWISGKVLWC